MKILRSEAVDKPPGVFFDAKSDEIIDVFTGGPDVGTRGLTQKLNSMAPGYARKWRQIQ